MNTNITLTTEVVRFITVLFIPLVVGLITKYQLHPFLKFVTNAVLSTVAALINVSITGEGVAVISKASLIEACYTIVISTVIYLGVYRPLNANTRLLPDFGINVASWEAPKVLPTPDGH